MEAAEVTELCNAYWSNPARLIFPYLEEEDPWEANELPETRPVALYRCMDPFRLMQATCAGACHDLQHISSVKAVAYAYMIFAKFRHSLKEGLLGKHG